MFTGFHEYMKPPTHKNQLL